MLIKALLLLLGASQAQNEGRQLSWQDGDPIWTDRNGRKPVYIDTTCPGSKVYSFVTGRCYNTRAGDRVGIKPRCHVQERWDFQQNNCIRNCYPNMYFYPQDRGATGGTCFNRAELMEAADPLCQSAGKRYDVWEAMCIAENRVPRPVQEYAIRRDGVALIRDKRANEAALAAAEFRAADLKIEQIGFIDEARKSLNDLKKLQRAAEREAAVRRGVALKHKLEADRVARAQREEARRVAALQREAERVARMQREAERVARLQAELREVAARRAIAIRREAAARRAAIRREMIAKRDAAERRMAVRRAVEREAAARREAARREAIARRQAAARAAALEQSLRDAQEVARLQAELARALAKQKEGLTVRPIIVQEVPIPVSSNRALDNALRAADRGWPNTVNLNVRSPQNACRVYQKYSRVESKCIDICPKGYTFKANNLDQPCVREVICDKGFYLRLNECKRTPSCGLRQKFNPVTEQCVP